MFVGRPSGLLALCPAGLWFGAPDCHVRASAGGGCPAGRVLRRAGSLCLFHHGVWRLRCYPGGALDQAVDALRLCLRRHPPSGAIAAAQAIHPPSALGSNRLSVQRASRRPHEPCAASRGSVAALRHEMRRQPALGGQHARRRPLCRRRRPLVGGAAVAPPLRAALAALLGGRAARRVLQLVRRPHVRPRARACGGRPQHDEGAARAGRDGEARIRGRVGARQRRRTVPLVGRRAQPARHVRLPVLRRGGAALHVRLHPLPRLLRPRGDAGETRPRLASLAERPLWRARRVRGEAAAQRQPGPAAPPSARRAVRPQGPAALPRQGWRPRPAGGAAQRARGVRHGRHRPAGRRLLRQR
mmetsp:Transcript_25001/g.84238  ORF Transcript_25001/g.84238 Transcript_25001/m.84238 type:complete len:357 (-) Transcript_25001:261-1331(-)